MQTEHSRSYASPIHGHESKLADRSLDDLLAMALRYLSEDNPRQAEDMFWMLAESHTNTPQGVFAKSKLRVLAHEYERDGCDHEARAIYERLIHDDEGDNAARTQA